MKQRSQTLRTQINSILNIDRDELYGKKRLSTLNFEDNGKESFEAIFNLVEELSKCHFDRVPSNKIAQITQQLTNYFDLFQEAKNLNLDHSHPKGERDSIVQRIEGNYEQLFNEISPVIGFVNQAGTDFKQIERDARQILSETKKNIESEIKQIKVCSKESEDILKSMRAVSSEAGVSQNAIHYSDAQKEHSKKAIKWYRGGVSLFVVLVLFTIFSILSFIKANSNEFQFGYLEFGFIILISLLLYAINFCNRNFQAEKHNETINANKARTLATFRSFVEGTDNANVKDRVLIYASASAFSNPSTGFGKSEHIPLPPGAEIVKQAFKEAPGK